MIENMVLKSAPTITVSGGTDQTFAPDGTVVTRGISVSDVAEADIRKRAQCVFKNTSGSLQPNGTWSKNRRSMKYVKPGLLPDGTQDFPFVEINIVYSPLWTANELADLKEKGAQMLMDLDTASFILTGALK